MADLTLDYNTRPVSRTGQVSRVYGPDAERPRKLHVQSSLRVVWLPLASRIDQTNVLTVPSAAPTDSKAALNEGYKCYEHHS